ncbi:MAG TPA: class I SAM-dependent methyltransferase [Clostridiaceae bacterium]|nr:class I SAM-dependent methyltransferase [Clostridiaceae bacterium]
MFDINYPEWVDYIETIFKNYDIQPELIADLGCGTGSFCLEMAGRGYNMIGIDISTEMLSRAMLKLESQGVEREKVLFLNQDMSRFELFGTVDAIVSLLDSINYITDKNDLKRMISLVENYLNPGGLFIFDVNSVYKFEKIFANNVFYSIDDEITYIWENTYDKNTKLCKFDLTFFISQNEYYKRFDEVHFERAYSIEELSEIVEDSGLELLKVYEGLSFCKPSINSERLFFICKKHN